jgi:hypothetical protein
VRRGALVATEAGGIERITPVLFSAGGLDGGEVEARIGAGEAVYVPIEALYAGETERCPPSIAALEIAAPEGAREDHGARGDVTGY